MARATRAEGVTNAGRAGTPRGGQAAGWGRVHGRGAGPSLGAGSQVCRKAAAIRPGRRAGARTVPSSSGGGLTRNSLRRGPRPYKLLQTLVFLGGEPALSSVCEASRPSAAASGGFRPSRLFFPSLVPVVPANGRGEAGGPEAGSVHFRVGERAATAAAAAAVAAA